MPKISPTISIYPFLSHLLTGTRPRATLPKTYFKNLYPKGGKMDSPQSRNEKRELRIRQSIERERVNRYVVQKIEKLLMPATIVFCLGIFGILLGGTLNTLIPVPLLVFGVYIFAWHIYTNSKIEKELTLQKKIHSEME